jgi:calnexin
MLIDNKSSKNGSLLEDFAPPVNPPAEISDPDDKKPEDWVDEARIPDPEATKPEDWDEDAPFEIVDDEAEKPADWLDDEPTTIPDPEAEKPEDWDDEEDGDWIPPQVPNPKCEEASGCGPWEPPMKKNPAYKGKWTAEYIDNPAYKGVWSARMIANPDFYEDKTPANFEPMGAIGFEIWTMQSDILFDNIYIGHSEEDAKTLREQTWAVKRPIEEEEESKTKPKPSDIPKSPNDLVFKDDPVKYITEKLQLFFTLAQKDPIEAVKFMPEVAGGIGGVMALIIAIVVLLAGPGPQPPSKEDIKKTAQKAKETAVDAKEKAAEAVTSGVEKTKEEVNKRATRSSKE